MTEISFQVTKKRLNLFGIEKLSIGSILVCMSLTPRFVTMHCNEMSMPHIQKFQVGQQIECMRNHSARKWKYRMGFENCMFCFEIGLSRKGFTKSQNNVCTFQTSLYTFAFLRLSCVTVQCVRKYSCLSYIELCTLFTGVGWRVQNPFLGKSQFQ